MNLLYRWVPVLIWMGIIFFFSSQQRVEVSDIDSINFIVFKTLHIIEYSILFLLIFRATNNHKTSFVVTILYAISDEMHQLFVPTREGAARDVIIDTIGAILAWKWLKQLLPRLPKKLSKWARGLLLLKQE